MTQLTNATPATTVKRPRALYVDVLNVIAIFGVVFLHVRANYWHPADTPRWWAENVLSAVFAIAVPIFFMNSGRNLLGFLRRDSISTFFRKRLLKVVVPYVVWGQLYLLFHAFVLHRSDYNLQRIGATIFGGSGEVATFWYLEATIGIYLIIPVLALALAGAEKLGLCPVKVVAALTALAFFSAALVPLIRGYFPGFMPDLEIPLSGYVLYFLLGYLITNIELSRMKRWVIYALGAVGLASFIFVAGGYMLRHDVHADLWNGYLSVGTVFFAAAVYVAAHNTDWSFMPQRIASLFTKLSGLTFGVFLIHLMLIDVLARISPANSFPEVLLRTVVVWVLSLLAVWLLRLIKPIRTWVIPG